MNELVRHLEWLDELKYIVDNRMEMIPTDRSEFIQLEEKNRKQFKQLFRDYLNFTTFEQDIKSLDTYYPFRHH
jgi:hypothetical protein